jgi:hypothetical protein
MMKCVCCWFRFVFLLLCITTGWGCGKPAPKLVPVSGIVVNGDKPIPWVTVLFAGSRSKEGQNLDAYAQTDAHGSFTLYTGQQQAKGAAVGHYKVSVTSESPHPLIPAKFNQFGTTTLEVDVPEGGANDLKLDLRK